MCNPFFFQGKIIEKKFRRSSFLQMQNQPFNGCFMNLLPYMALEQFPLNVESALKWSLYEPPTLRGSGTSCYIITVLGIDFLDRWKYFLIYNNVERRNRLLCETLQGTYLTYAARSHALFCDISEESAIGSFNGEFWGVLASNQVLNMFVFCNLCKHLCLVTSGDP